MFRRMFSVFTCAACLCIAGTHLAPGAPSNDAFAKRVALSGANVSLYGSFDGATLEPGEPHTENHFGTLWWAWTPPEDGLLTVTAPTNVSSHVYIYTGSSLSNLSLLAAGPPTFVMRVTASEQYFVRVGSAALNQPQPFTTSLALLSRPANFYYTNAVSLGGTDVVVVTTADLAPADPGGPGNTASTPNTLWWKWTSPGIGTVTIDSTESSLPVNLWAYYGLGPPWSIFAYGPRGLDPITSLTDFVQSGQVIGISASGGNSSGTNKVVLRVRMVANYIPANDGFTNAIRLNGTHISTTGTFTNATRESGEPTHGASGDYQTVWYRWTSPGRGNATFSTTSATQPNLAAYRGTVLTNLSTLGIIPSGTFWLPVLAGDDTVFAVTDALGVPFQLNVDFWPSPANDDFANPAAIQPGNHLEIDTRGATKEAGEPNHAGSTSSRNTLWFTWTPSTGGPVTLFATSTNADPVLAVYLGNSLTSLVAVAGVNDIHPFASDAGVSFNVTAGQTYRIAVSTRANSGGHCHLDFTTGTAPTVAFTTSPAGLTNVAGGAYVFDFTVTDPEGDVASVALNSGNAAVYPVAGPPYQVTLSNLAPGGYTFFATAVDAQGHVGASTFSNYTVVPSNDLVSARVPVTSIEFLPINVSRSQQQPGEPFAASWWSWIAPSNGWYLAEGTFQRLAVYEVSGTNLNLLGARTNTVGARVAFQGGAGKEYVLGIGSANSEPTALLITNALSNDFFTNSIPLAGTNGVFSFPFRIATKEPGEANHGGLGFESSAWWNWTAPTSGTLVVQTTSSLSTRNPVYSGIALGGLTVVGARSPVVTGFPEQWIASVTAANNYKIAAAVGTFSSGWSADLAAEASVRYAFFTRPANDDFTNAFTIGGQQFEGTGHTFGATAEPGQPDASPVVWWSWTSPRNGQAIARVGARSAGCDAYLGSSLATLMATGNHWVVGSNRYVSFSAVAGSNYYLGVTGSSSEYVLTVDVTPPANDDFTNRLLLASTPARMTGDLLQASSEPGEFFGAGAKSVWWTWTAPATRIYTVAPAFSYPATTFVYTGTTLNQLTPVPRAAGGAYTFLGETGTSYQIAIVGVPGPYQLLFDASIVPNDIPLVNIVSPTNGQRLLAGQPVPVTIHAQDPDGTVTASTCGYYGRTTSGPDVFWSLQLSNLPPGLATVGATATDDFGAIQTAAPVTFRLAPANDDFEQRVPVADGETTIAGSNIGAALQPGEPVHTMRTGGASVWWTLTAPFAGDWTVDTRGSSFDTVLAVYTGSNLAALTLVAANDDRRPGDPASAITFTATPATAYVIVVDTADGQTGDIKLHISPLAANDHFVDATLLPRPSVGRTFTSGASKEGGETNHAGVAGGHSVWWRWTAPDSSTWFATTVGSDFDTTLAVYTGTNVGALTLVAANDDDGSVSSSRVQFNAAAGQEYWIAVDGFAGDAGSAQLVFGKTGSLYLAPYRAGTNLGIDYIGRPAQPFVIEQSTNLAQWFPVHTQQLHSGWLAWPAGTNNASQLFQRARTP
jgi:hypothetical protein